MKPPRFKYHDPDTVEEALDLLACFGEESKVLAGGQSLMPLLNLRLARPQHVIDINKISALEGITESEGRVTIGALTRHADVESSGLIAKSAPLLSEAVQFIGHEAIRNRGTLGGSLAHADPSAELPAVMTALDATFTLASLEGTRQIPASEFFLMPLTTAAAAEELLLWVDFPAQSPGAGSAVVELARRSGDFALVGVAVVVELDAAEQVEAARVVSFGTGLRPVRHTETESLLVGQKPTEAVLDDASRCAASEVAPSGDKHGSTQYRKTVTGVLVRRAVQRAHGRARCRGEGSNNA